MDPSMTPLDNLSCLYKFLDGWKTEDLVGAIHCLAGEEPMAVKRAVIAGFAKELGRRAGDEWR